MLFNIFKEPVFYLLLVATIALTFATITLSQSSTEEKIHNMKLGVYNPYREFNNWVNGIVFDIFRVPFLPELLKSKFGDDMGYYASLYVRDFIGGTLLYWIVGSIWHVMIYHVWVDDLFTKKNKPLPKSDVIIDQMLLSQSSVILYAALPVVSEILIENNMTLTYFYIDQIGGWPYYFFFLVIYYICVEIGIYWVHRTLHTNKFLYKYVHGLHHKYNKESTLTPWASIAFNPIDGILQCSPYVISLFFVPVHYYTHIAAVFLTGIWATYIHDAALGNIEPIMGSKYHTVHHTHYHYNFGQMLTYCDMFWGTLRSPEDLKARKDSSDNLKDN